MSSGSRTVTADSDGGGRSVTLGLGTNLGDRFDNLRRALAALRRDVGPIRRLSRIYATDPVGVVDQPEFWNMVACFTTDRRPAAVHAAAQRIEAEVGRTPTYRHGPRIIDIDVLLADDDVVTSPSLELPHPRLHERAFVLRPLAELLPDRRHPVIGATFHELAETVAHQGARPLDEESERLRDALRAEEAGG
jgi:2-amino-4-hydroxy-6-hydroxymethyldihydropteridine diphosphokinase